MLKNSITTKSGNGRRKRGKRARGSRSAGLQQTVQGYTYTVNPGPYLAPLMPKEFSVALYDRLVTPYAAITATQTKIYGLLEFFNQKPLYLNEFYQMYKYCRVTACHYHFEVVNTGLNPIQIAFTIMPVADALLSPSMTQIVEKPGSVEKVISAAGGLDRAQINKTAVAQEWVGNAYYTKDYWVTSAQAGAATSSPLDTDEPVGVFGITPIAATPITAVLVHKVTYHLQFFDLELPPIS